jgi:heme/copper-type cytochrome/quinol oxidase subunit 2
MFYLIIAAVVLLLIVIGLLVRAQVLIDVFTKSNEKRAGLSNKINGLLFPIFFVFGLIGFIWLTVSSREFYLPEASSLHGVITDNLFWFSMAVITIVFIATHVLLFFFPYVYQFKEGNKALFYPVNHRLEFIWTVIPAIVLSLLVFTGWKAWSDITKAAPADAVVVELVGKQFNWLVRYPGMDKALGKHNFRKIDDLQIHRGSLLLDNLPVTGNDIIVKGLNNYKGWSCWAGLDMLSIDMWGDIYRSECKQGGKLGNLENYTLPTEPITCPANKCSCLSDIYLQKESKVTI